MIDPMALLTDGGPLIYLILLVFVAGVPVMLVFAVGSLRLRVPAAFHLCVPLVAIAVGILGTYQGFALVQEAMSRASVEVRATLAAAGLSVALFTHILGLLCAGALAALGALSMGLVAALRSRRDAVTSLGLAVPGLVVAALGVAAVAWVPLVGAAAAVAGLAVAAGAARTPDQTDRVSAIVEMRLGATVLGITAVGLAGAAVWYGAQSRWLDVVAKASAETQAAMLAQAADGFQTALAVTVGLAVLLAVAGVISVVGNLRSLGLGGVVSTVVSVLFAILLAAPALAPAMSLEDMATLTLEFADKRAAQLETWGVSVPVTSRLARPERPGLMITLGAEIRVDDQVVSAAELESAISAAHAAAPERHPELYGSDYSGQAVIEADASVRFSDLAAVLAGCRAAGVQDVSFAARRSDRAGLVVHRASLVDTRVPPAAGGDWPLDLRVAPQGRAFRVQASHGAVDVDDLDGVLSTLIRLKRQQPEVDTAFVHVSAKTTVAEYLALVETMVENPDRMLDGRPEPLFPNLVLTTEPLPSRG